MPKLVDRNKFLTAVQKMFGDIETITRSDVQKVCAKNKLDYPNWLVNDVSRRVSRGVYSLKETPVEKTKTVSAPVNTETAVAMAVAAVQLNQAAVVDLVPEKAKGYVPFGNFADVRQIVKSNKFYPMYITGLSGKVRR
jgi:hypothetical protein